MKVIIAGIGATGMHLAKMLSGEDHDLVLIDPEADKLRQAESHLDLLTLKGSSSYMSILREAGVKKADLLIAVTNNDDVNILTCILAKKLGVKTVVARINDPEYFDSIEEAIYENLGIDRLIYPDRIAAGEIVKLLKQSAVTETYEFSNGKLVLFLIKIEKNAPIINKSLFEISRGDDSMDFRAVAIRRGSDTIIPTGKDEIFPDDQVYVITKPESINKLIKYTGHKEIHIDKIMIVGGSKIGKRAAYELEKHFNIKLIDENRQKCNELVEFLSKTLVIHSDCKDIEALEDEGIRKMDAFVAVTDNAETNIFACLMAKKMGVKKTIALVDNIELIEMSHNVGIDAIINKKLIAASYIYSFTLDAEVAELKFLSGVDADVLEFVVKKGSKVTIKKIRDLKFPKGSIIGGIVRNDISFIATGDTNIIENDHVVVFSLPHVIHKVEKFFN